LFGALADLRAPRSRRWSAAVCEPQGALQEFQRLDIRPQEEDDAGDADVAGELNQFARRRRPR